MNEQSIEMGERLLGFAAGVVKYVSSLEKTYTGRHISGQLMRSATSAGANWEESRGAESHQDFVHKLQIVLKELRESLFWLRLIEKSDLIPVTGEQLQVLLQEAKELNNIIGKSVYTAKNRQS
jgi:four helix bundle protein